MSKFSFLKQLAVLLCAVGGLSQAHADSLIKPKMMVILDSSGSMLRVPRASRTCTWLCGPVTNQELQCPYSIDNSECPSYSSSDYINRYDSDEGHIFCQSPLHGSVTTRGQSNCSLNTFGDGSDDYPGVDYDGDGLPNDSRMYIAKQALTSMLAGTSEVEFGLMRFYQDEGEGARSTCKLNDPRFQCRACSSGDQCQDGVFINDGAISYYDAFPYGKGEGKINYDGSFACQTDKGGQILVEVGDQNHADIYKWIDGKEDFPYSPTGNREIRADGQTPLGLSLEVASKYFRNSIMPTDPQKACRNYSVLLITDGINTCSVGPTPEVMARTMYSNNPPIKTYVIGFGEDVEDGRASLDSIAQQGGTEKAYFADDPESLQLALAKIIQEAIPQEICDGIDNDCDGETDENLYKSCSTECGMGTQTCVNGAWTACDAVVPTEEICDGIDNDCDGETDEGLQNRPCSNECGTGVQSCENGKMTACSVPEPWPEICDGIDNDCDGETDEGVTMPCSTTCGQGVRYCINGRFSSECVAPEPTEEVCDGIDNDCDGIIDNQPNGMPLSRICNLGCGSGTEYCIDGEWSGCDAIPVMPEICDGIDNDCDGLVDENVTRECSTACGTGIEYCENGRFVGCTAPKPTREVCDGIDNDCDGETDEDVINGIEVCDGLDNDCDGLTDEGDDGLPLIADCSTVCGSGTAVCENGRFANCTAPQPTAEICDGIDNDCNGEIDDNVTRSCFTVCGRGKQTCSNGEWLECDAPEPTEEICDGIDNDCDGETDEDVTRECRNNCGVGIERCAAGEWFGCTAPMATEEVCDGVDNNCDGQTDEPENLKPCEGVGQKCINGRCADVCVNNECPGEFTCIDGYCIMDPCKDKNEICQKDGLLCFMGECVTRNCYAVNCGSDRVCSNGICVNKDCFINGCSAGEICSNGQCVVDPCVGVFCGQNAFCRLGSCIGSCTDVHCEAGTTCKQGECVTDPCVNANCGESEACDNGACVADPCRDVNCLPGHVCEAGRCVEDPCLSTICPSGYVCENSDCVPAPVQPDAGELPPPAVDGGVVDLDSTVVIEPDAAVVVRDAFVPPSYFDVPIAAPDSGVTPETSGGDSGCSTAPGEKNSPWALLLVPILAAFGLLRRSSKRKLAKRAALAAMATLPLGCGDDGGSSSAAVPDAAVAPTICAATGLPITIEICDGIDNDCNGQTDEVFNLLSDVLNCGACGNKCEYQHAEAECIAGNCKMGACLPGASDRDGNPENGCEVFCSTGSGEVGAPELCDGLDNDCDGLIDEDFDFMGDPENCGACGNKCEFANAQAYCQNGECRMGACNVGFGNFDGNTANGCEGICITDNPGPEVCDLQDNDCDGETDEGFDLMTDGENCGACGKACLFANGAGLCNQGVCELVSCRAGFVDADHDPETGCEKRCELTEGGVEKCDGIDNDCDGYTDEDFDLMTDVENCGSCGHSCDLPNAVSVCNMGACEFDSCVLPYENRDGYISNGCEHKCEPTNDGVEVCDGIDNDCNGEIDEGFDVTSDINNCGACGHVCSAPNANVACVNSQCVITSCEPNHVDLDLTFENGCESQCIPTNGGVEICDGLDNDCDGATDEDFRLYNDKENCGACGVVCTAEHGTPFCSSGVCKILACDVGYVDLDKVYENGCECVQSNGGIEICDGLDNDCNGIIDDPELMAPPADFEPCLTRGVCADIKPTCVDRTWVCQYPPTYEANGETLCDGLDNDCDGQVDEMFPTLGTACDALYEDGTRALGVCGESGFIVCDGPSAVKCSAELHLDLKGEEVCDNLDNDCDGETDEDSWALARIDGDPSRDIAAFDIFVYEASRTDATETTSGVRFDRACSKPNALPWNNVDYETANEACANAGCRLCTADEWHLACASVSNQDYPYGNHYSAQSCNGQDYDADPTTPENTEAVVPTGSLAECKRTHNGVDVFDQSGNVWEWTSENKSDSTTAAHGVRGGGFGNFYLGLTCDYTLATPDNASRENIGFRCCCDAQ